MRLNIRPDSRIGVTLSSMLWPLPTVVQHCIKRLTGGRPVRLVYDWTFDRRGRRRITRARYLWDRFS